MKILYYSPHPNLNLSDPSGYATHMNEIINAFEKEGHEVKRLIAGGEIRNLNEGMVKPSFIKRIIKHVLPQYLWESLKDYGLIKFDKAIRKELTQLVFEFKPDIVYERFNYLQSSGSEVAKKHGIKHYIEVNSPYSFERKKYQGNSFFIKQSNKIEGQVLSDAKKVIVVSSALKNHFIEKHHLAENKFVITPNAVNLDNVKVSDKNYREKLKYNSTDIVLGFVGSISEWHGVHLLIDLQEKLRDSGLNNIKTLVVGGGEQLDYLKHLAENREVEHLITFTGNVPHKDVYNYINCFDVALMPKSNWYGSPIKIFEYAALKKPIIAPNNVPLNDVIEHKVHAFLSKEDVESLYHSVKQFIENTELRNQLAQEFHEKVSKEHTWDNMAKLILS